MAARNFNLLPCLLLAACLGAAAARSGGSGMDGFSFDRIDPSSGMPSQDAARDRLEKAAGNFSRLQTMPSIQYSPDAGSQLANIQNILAKAQENLAAGKTQAVLDLCAQIDQRIGEMFMTEKFRVRTGSGPGSEGDSDRLMEEQKARAELDFERAHERFISLAQRLGAGKNPCAAEVMARIKGLLDQASLEIASDRIDKSRRLLAQADALSPELQRLAQESSYSEKQGASGLSHANCNDQQPSTQASLAQASEMYRRITERFIRLTEQSGTGAGAKTAALQAKVRELLNKAKEALATQKPEAAKELVVKAEGLLPEIRTTASSAEGAGRLTPAAWQRLKAKLDRAAEIVASSGSGKAARILEKGQEHFERAERNHADGRSSRAEVEMDIALKLAAKAVDIARAGGR